jgi:hypothetical protein
MRISACSASGRSGRAEGNHLAVSFRIALSSIQSGRQGRPGRRRRAQRRSSWRGKITAAAVMAMLAVLELRLKAFDAEQFTSATASEQRCKASGDAVPSPGTRKPVHTYWIFPIVSREPKKLIAAAGFDACDLLALARVEAPEDRPELGPAARHLQHGRAALLSGHAGRAAPARGGERQAGNPPASARQRRAIVPDESGGIELSRGWPRSAFQPAPDPPASRHRSHFRRTASLPRRCVRQ